MRLLAVEASTARPSLALCEAAGPGEAPARGGVGEIAVLARRELELGPRQGAALLDAASALVSEAGVAWRDLGAVLAGRGPGSYTGLRVSLTAARAWALPWNVPVWAAPGPAALAFRLFRGDASPDAVRLAGHARRGQLWVAEYRRGADGLPVPADPAQPFGLVPEDAVDPSSLSLPPGEPPRAEDLVALWAAGRPSEPPVPVYLNPAVAIAPRFDAATGAPLP